MISFCFMLYRNTDIHCLRHEAEYFGLTPLGKLFKQNNYIILGDQFMLNIKFVNSHATVIWGCNICYLNTIIIICANIT